MAKKISFFQDINSLIRIYLYLKKYRYDIIHLHSTKAGILFRIVARLINSPVIIYTPHCFYFNAYGGLRRKLYATVERFFSRITDCIVISGNEELSVRKESIALFSKTLIINNAINPNDYSLFDSENVRKIWNIPNSHFVVVGVGRLVKQKNWDSFLKIAELVLQKNKSITFVIAGEGPGNKEIFEKIKRYKISENFRLVGHSYEISKIYSIANLFMSTSRWEGLPYTYLEALHFKLPMVLMYTEGVEYFVKHTNAICFPHEEYNNVRDQILSIASSIFPRENNTQIINFNQFIEQHRDLYFSVLKKDYKYYDLNWVDVKK